MILRRLYLYAVAAAGLAMLVVGLTQLGAMLISAGDGMVNRDALAALGAMVIVGFPIWLVHFWMAQARALRDPEDRKSALRRLYLYGAALGLGISATAEGWYLVDNLAQNISGLESDSRELASITWDVLVLAAAWAFHLWVAARDRGAVGEHGASATLRRWYTYLLLSIGLMMALLGASSVISLLLRIGGTLNFVAGIHAPLAGLTVGTAVWLFHEWQISSQPVAEQDGKSTLRLLQGFIFLGISVIAVLSSLSQVLYYGLDRALGQAMPAGVQGDLWTALSSPLGVMVAFGTAWFLYRRRVGGRSRTEEPRWQAGVRRLYVHLVSLISLSTLAVGVGGLLWTLSDQVCSIALSEVASDWRDQVSLFTTLIVVGLPVWLAHWRPVVELGERTSLARRLYTYASLLVGVLVLLGAAASLVYNALSLALQTSPSAAASATLNAGRSLAILVTAAAVAFYHLRVIIRDSRAKSPSAAESPAPQPNRTIFELEVSGADELELHAALKALPAGATYHLRPRPVS